MKLKLLLGLAFLPTAISYAQTQQQTENLYTFARLYGYVRYFHPSDAVVMTDWDKLAIYGAQQVEKAANQQELQQTLEELFKPIAPSLQLFPTGSNPVFNQAAITPASTTGMKTVQWQYNGYGAGNNTETYQAVRTNSYIKAAPPKKQGSNFSTITNSIPAQLFRGRMVRYSAAIKAENLTEGTGQLWLRVDLDNKGQGFFDNMGNRPVTGRSESWRRDTIMGRIDANATMIAFGCFLMNQGTLLLDDVKLEIETEEGWQTIPAVNGDFEQDRPQEAPRAWYFNTEDLLFTVKTTDRQANTGTQSLLMERAAVPAPVQATTTLFKDNLPAGTTIKKDIGSGISIIMPVALWGDGHQTYPLTDTAQIARMNKDIASKIPERLSGNNLYVRLADIILTWNVFQHFHPYYKEWTTNWDQDLRQALKDCYNDKTADDFGTTLKTLTAKMRDGHIYVAYPAFKTMAYLPLKWEWLEKQLVITAVLSPETGLVPGDVITAINGQPVTSYINSTMLTVAAGTPNALMERTLTTLSSGPDTDSLLLSVSSDGSPNRSITLPFSMSANKYYTTRPPQVSYKEIDPNTIYVNLSEMPWEEIKPKLPALAAAKAVIFDLRGYPKDMNGFSIIPHLLQKSEDHQWMQKQELMLPDHEKAGWHKTGWKLKKATPHINGKVFFLTNGSAISYAESVMGYIKGMKLATIIGEPTAGANGDVTRVSLPGGYSFSFSGLKVTNHDGTQHFTKGISPDITVLRTIKGVRENRDEVMDKAIQLSK